MTAAADRTLHAIDATLTATTRPRPIESREDRMRDARNDRTFATYLTATDRDQLDARAAAAEQERDDALDDLKELRTHHTQLHNRTTALENDLRSQTRAVRELAAERDQARTDRDKLVNVIGRLISLPPEAIVDAYEVGYGTTTAAGLGSPADRAQDEPAGEEVQWACRWLDADGNVLDEMPTRDNARETAEDRARRLARNRPPSVPAGQVVRYRVVTTAEVVATFPADRES